MYKLYNKKTKIKDTTYFKLTYTVGYYANASFSFEIYYENNKYLASYKNCGVREEDKLIKTFDIKQVKELECILFKYKINKWNGFNKTDNNVLDGDSFYLSYENKMNEKISASGYMKYPKGYKEFEKEISDFFKKIFKKEIENTTYK